MYRKLFTDGVLGLVITAVALALIECFLWGMELGDAPESANWSRGFDENAAYILPNPEVPGGWRTHFQGEGDQERDIPPKTSDTRVLMFGGSNTAGFPSYYLTRQLNERAQGRAFETANLGRKGYGSARVRLIFMQALENLEPEIVIIYTGHNEFVERGFEMDLEAAALGAWSHAPAMLARKTRMFRALVDYYSKDARSTWANPDAWESEYQKFADITYDETVRYFAAFEDNLRGMCEAARARGVEVLLSTIAYNRLSAPYSSTFPKGLDPAVVALFEEDYGEALALLPDYLSPLLPTRPIDHLRAFDWGYANADMKLGDDVLESWRESSGILAGRARILPREEYWGEKVRMLDKCLVRFHVRDAGERTRAELERAEMLLRGALGLIPDHPGALFRLAVVEYLLARDESVVLHHLEQAASYDRAPLKGSKAINDIIKRVAGDVDGVELVDVDALLAECVPMSIVGWEWMTDRCHLNGGAQRAVMEIFAREIIRRWGPAGSRERGD